MEHLFDMRPDRPGYRLQRLEVFNWGTFDSTNGQIHRFEPQGRTSLLVGHNGSGKSTLVDAILTLLVDSRSRNYNVAAGAKKTERTSKSYIKGAYDRTTDESQASVVRYLRPQGSHLTAISGVFQDEHLGKSFTLTQVMYLKADGADEKVYAIADTEHELKTDLAGLRKADDVRDHLKRQGYQTTKTYVEYQAWLTKRTGMRGKAIDMLNQTVYVKDIQSLNDFIRRHMLESHDWRNKVQRLLTHFDDLSQAHQELVRARRAEELLAPVEKLGKQYQKQAAELEGCEQQLEAAATFFPLQRVRLFEPAVAEQQTRVAEMVVTIDRMDRELNEKRGAVHQLRQEIEQAGGERLKKIPNLIEKEELQLQHKKTTFQQYYQRLQTCGFTEIVNSQKLFNKARGYLQQEEIRSAERLTDLKQSYEEAIGTKAGIEHRLHDERAELELLQQRRTNLPPRHTAMRSQICADLNLDESVLPFAAELMAVNSTERRWEASAEMVLRPFALSLLVPERYYPRVRSYVETNRIHDARGDGQKLDYICVGRPAEVNGDRIDAQSLVNKLQFKPRHNLAPWVRGEVLRRFDFRCCSSIEEFNDTPRMAMTANRHVKFNSERHQKDDRPRTVDPRYFVLGWDNTEKKRRIAAHIEELSTERQKAQESVSTLGSQVEQQEAVRRAALAALEIIDFDAIDLKRHEVEIATLKAEKKELEEANDAVKALNKRLATMEDAVAALAQDRDLRLAEKARLEADIERVSRLLHTASGQVKQSRESGAFAKHEPYFAAIMESLGEAPLTIENVFLREENWKVVLNQKVSKLRQPLQQLAERLMNKMLAYLRDFREESADLDASIHALASFLGRLEQLREEDLPRHEKKFKDRLNDQVTTEIAVFNTELREERKHIEEKIAQLNDALGAVEYNRGTRMRLEPRPAQDREIDEFRRALRECLDESLEHTDEANEARFNRVKALVERLADKDRTAWRNKVIDVRNWFDFSAQEIVNETGKIQSSYDGSSGQSGGEKAKLAFTILVAALAYQFDVDPHGHTPGRFHFVVVDEMFSKVDDQNAQYALRLFKQFGLQLLIVAPLDAKARITEPFVDRYVHTVKDDATSCSQLYSMTAQEYEEVVKQFTANGSPSTPLRKKAK